MQNIESLLHIMRALRDPDSGCPWDLEQDFKSISAWTLEEAYEVIDAISHDDANQLCHELGDLLFQIVYHAQMAQEQGWFDFEDVVEQINRKLIRRHPHVFADEQVETAEQQSRRWDEIKQSEQTTGENNPVLTGVGKAQPALRKAEKLQMQAAKYGFDWKELTPVFTKVREELDELEEEVAATRPDPEKMLDECGDCFFVLVNLARKLSVNPEIALARANEKFIRRFSYVESVLQKQGRSLDDASLEEMDSLWNQAKIRETAAD